MAELFTIDEKWLKETSDDIKDFSRQLGLNLTISELFEPLRHIYYEDYHSPFSFLNTHSRKDADNSYTVLTKDLPLETQLAIVNSDSKLSSDLDEIVDCEYGDSWDEYDSYDEGDSVYSETDMPYDDAEEFVNQFSSREEYQDYITQLVYTNESLLKKNCLALNSSDILPLEYEYFGHQADNIRKEFARLLQKHGICDYDCNYSKEKLYLFLNIRFTENTNGIDSVTLFSTETISITEPKNDIFISKELFNLASIIDCSSYCAIHYSTDHETVYTGDLYTLTYDYPAIAFTDNDRQVCLDKLLRYKYNNNISSDDNTIAKRVNIAMIIKNLLANKKSLFYKASMLGVL